MCNERYFDILVDRIRTPETPEYMSLLSFLFTIEFVPYMDVDQIRCEKIMELRDEYGGHGEAPPYVTVFELMAGLAISMEDNIMTNTKFGDRTPKWFWMMIDNLGLDGMTNENLDSDYVFAVISRWIRREFDANGDGSPFPMKKTAEDMRDVDIWRSLCLYVTENFNGRW